MTNFRWEEGLFGPTEAATESDAASYFAALTKRIALARNNTKHGSDLLLTVAGFIVFGPFTPEFVAAVLSTRHSLADAPGWSLHITLVFFGARRSKGNTVMLSASTTSRLLAAFQLPQGSFTIHMERAGSSGV
ncbi:MAG: hypothetical protein WCF38_00915 [Pseudolabrys sp.]